MKSLFQGGLSRCLRVCLFMPFLVAGCGESASPNKGEPVGSESAAAERVTEAAEKGVDAPNFLVLIGDDMGVETLASYGIGEVTASTPNLDALSARGVQFDHFWVQPTCSPTRATLLTGRYGFRTGVLAPAYPREDLIDVHVPEGDASAPLELAFSPRGYITPGTVLPPPPFLNLAEPPVDGLPPDEVTLPQLLKALPSAYATAAVGKWHLADSRNGWLSSPNRAGFDYYSGLIMGETDSYYRWLHVTQGQASAETGYIDERTLNDGIHWLDSQIDKDNPWFLWVAFINPHTPFTLPPQRLLHSEEARALKEETLSPENTRPYAMAMLEAMDTLIGRLLDAIPEEEMENTYVIFLGDNGSVKWAQPSPPVDPERAKMTVYEGGVRTPLIVSGPGVAGGQRTAALANSVDLLATVMELATGEVLSPSSIDRPLDSESLVSVLRNPEDAGSREWIYADAASFKTGGINYTLRDQHYKLVSNSGAQELFDMGADPWEQNNLLVDQLSPEQQQAFEKLSSAAEALQQSH